MKSKRKSSAEVDKVIDNVRYKKITPPLLQNFVNAIPERIQTKKVKEIFKTIEKLNNRVLYNQK